MTTDAHAALWRCINEPRELLPEPCRCCWIPVCPTHGIPDCSPILNRCSWGARKHERRG